MQSEPFGAEAQLSFLRSRKRVDAVIMVCSLGEATPSQLARAIGVNTHRLRQIMFGGGSYAVELSPVRLGFVLVAPMHGRSYKFMISGRGRRKSRQWTARSARRGVAGAMMDEKKRAGAAAWAAAPSPGTSTG